MSEGSRFSPGDRIGRYRILEMLGEGGMGQVYAAEQTETVRRKVAIKVVKLGMDTKEVLARFEAERQALALLDHPNIAKVLDAGSTRSGQPFFVMEYVQGTPLTGYCDRHRLSTTERLELFIDLCHAVQHAHQKGIIHRDLKPDNVLVTVPPEGAPAPKVIDFGIAKALGQSLTELTLHTAQDQPMGTPAYMSPEQAEGGGLNVDTRTDVYTLGVILYELLVGARPIDMRGRSIAALAVVLRETDPEKPSSRFQSLGDHRGRIAQLRNSEVGALRSRLEGDLDWIVMKALEKDRTRRYDTVSALAMDVRRHLNDEPVTAGSPGASYRLRKFARRHRMGVAAGLAAAVGLIGGATLATVGMVRAQRAERLAEAEAAAATEVADFLVGLFESSDPGRALGEEVTAREILDAGAEQVRSGLEDQPLTQARLMHTMGLVYRELGYYEDAEELLDRALRLREEHLGPDDGEVASTLFEMGRLEYFKADYPRAADILERALRLHETAAPLDTLPASDVLYALGLVYTNQARYDEAERVLERALALAEGAARRDTFRIATRIGALGNLYTAQRRLTDAEAAYSRALDLKRRALGPDHPETTSSLSALGIAYWYQGRLDEAEVLFEQTLRARERVSGPDHRLTAQAYSLLGLLRTQKGDLEGAEPLYQTALEISERALGPTHLEVGQLRSTIASLYQQTGRYEEALTSARAALEIESAALGPDHPDVAGAMLSVAQALSRLDRLDEAATYLRRSVAILEEKAPGRRQLGYALVELQRVYLRQSRLPEAEEAAVKAIRFLEGMEVPPVREVAVARRGLADTYAAQSRYAEADSLYREVLAVFIAHGEGASARSAGEGFARILRESGRADAADSLEAELVEAIPGEN